MAEEKEKTKRRKGFLENLGLVTSDETEGEEQTSAAPAGTDMASSLARATGVPLEGAVTQTQPNGQSAAGVDPGAYKALMEKASAQQTAYTAYMASVAAIAALVPDEATRFKVAFATEKAKGVTLEQILSGVQTHMDVLEQERKGFEAVLARKVESTVGAREREAQGIRTSIEQKREQRAALDREIAALEKQEGELTGVITQERQQIEEAKARFLGAHTAVQAFYTTMRDTLAANLKGV